MPFLFVFIYSSVYQETKFSFSSFSHKLIGCCVLPVNCISSFNGVAQQIRETEDGSTLHLDTAVNTAPLEQQCQVHTRLEDGLYDHSSGAVKV